MAADVFISYAHNDRNVAEAACAKLEATGIRCWIAPRDILPGSTWPGQIIAAINDSQAFLLIYSSSANASDQIKHEVERAGNRRMKVIPFRIEDVPPSPDLEYFISNAQWLDAFDPPVEQHFGRLTETLARVLARPSGAQLADAKPQAAARQAPSTLRTRVVIFVLLLLAVSALGFWYFRPSRPQAPQDEYVRGVNALEQKDYPQAIERLTRTIEQRPNAEAYYNRGLANYFSGNLESAIGDWDRALALSPNWALAFRQRANAFAQKGDGARALADYNRAIELEPGEPRPYYNRALLYQNLREPENAVRDLETLLTLNPDAELQQSAKELLEALKRPASPVGR